MKRYWLACCCALCASAVVAQTSNIPAPLIVIQRTNDTALGANRSVTNNDNETFRSRDGTQNDNETNTNQTRRRLRADDSGRPIESAPDKPRSPIGTGRPNDSENNSRNTGSSPVTPLNR